MTSERKLELALAEHLEQMEAAHEMAECGSTANQFTPAQVGRLNGGIQHIYRFGNGYGASVVNHAFSHGVELAVLSWARPDSPLGRYELTYDTPVTSDVIGHLTPERLEGLLGRIAALPPAESAVPSAEPTAIEPPSASTTEGGQ
ncbi:hypothetical protein [Spongiactinospora sp. TRM90649]|uniref:hypothetical protein n=1 Tax=Spongiactinospora sp. TRM90649 TaxID=3031114 RepID=UPI0023F7CB84|nr:hypothetical protein [Spongiactinospora sp. TRM90649]MDF5756590.1 hypothetical protein [Spongiactinospora sp. TRM90649]